MFEQLIFLNFFFWFPWFNFYIEIFLLQFFLFYFMYMFFSSTNTYYILLYFWVLVVFFGLYLGLSQMELFLGFFWVAEFTVVFIAILLAFYLNTEGLNFNLNLLANKLYFFLIFFFNIFFFSFSSLNIAYEVYFFNWLHFEQLFEDYYEAFLNFVLNDFLVLFLNYYFFNSFEFVLLGLILFFGSVVCIVLNSFSKKTNFSNDLNYINLFGPVVDFLSFNFLRKQNLIKQANSTSSVRIFKKKNAN